MERRRSTEGSITMTRAVPDAPRLEHRRKAGGRRRLLPVLVALLASGLVVASTPASGQEAPAPERAPVPEPTVQGPLPKGTEPLDRLSPEVEHTWPFFATDSDLAAHGYVEEEFTYSGTATGYTGGTVVGTDVPYKTRMIVRRPKHRHKFNGTVLVEWQNVTAGYDLDALWTPDQIMRSGYVWVGVSAQRVGVNQLKEWSPARYGDLDVTGAGQFNADELSYDIYAQAAQAMRKKGGVNPLGHLKPRRLLSIGASQSAGRMTVYYNSVLPLTEPVFDGYGFIVGSAPTRVGDEPVFHVLSETDVRTPTRAPDTDQYRRWEVAGTAHSGWRGAEYRQSISARDLGEAPSYECDQPPYSRVPMHHVTAAVYDHLVRWVEHGKPPPTAPPLEFNEDGTKARDELGLAKGGIRLSQVEVPIALNTGDNSGETFCRLFGTYQPFDQATLDELYKNHGSYVSQVARVDHRNVRSGYIVAADAWANLTEAAHSDIGRRRP
jgi:hypothetical protein